MNNIELIKEDYKVGDAIRISCSLGVKEGILIDFLDTRIKIQPLGLPKKKPIYIEETTIKDWEELEIPESEIPVETQEQVPAEVIPEVVQEPVNKTVAEMTEEEEGGETEESAQELPQEAVTEEENKKVLPPHVKGFIDPATFEKPVLQKLPKSTVSDRLSSTYKGDDENCKIVSSIGYITDDFGEHGKIWDQKLETKIWFSADSICDDDLYDMENWEGIPVVYLKIDGAKGPKAVGICLPRPVYEMLAMADDKSDDKSTLQDAYDIVQCIKGQYPNNMDALQLEKDLRNKVKRRNIHSGMKLLDVESLKHESSFPKNPKKANKEDGKENPDQFKKEYMRAKELVNERKHKEALEHYLKAFKIQPTITLIKDICTQYCTLCSKKYLEDHPEEKVNVEKYRKDGRDFLSKNINKLPKEQSTYHFLETTYFVLHEYEKFIETIDKLLAIKTPSQRIFFMNKKAMGLIALNRKEEATEILQEVLKIDKDNQMTKNLLEKLSAENLKEDWDELLQQSEESDNPISPFLEEILDNYSAFYGVPNYIIVDETRLYSQKTYDDIVDQAADKDVSSDSQKRSQLLLTKAKISQRLTGAYDKRDFALYCNDMARLSIIKNPNRVVWDVVRFYFNESFSLTSSWGSTVRQFVQYLETLIPSKRGNIFQKLSDSEKRVSENLHLYVTNSVSTHDMDWLYGLLHPALYNEEISNRIAKELYQNKELRAEFKNRITALGKNAENLDSEEGVLSMWKELRDERYAAEANLKNSFLSKLQNNTLQKLNATMSGLSDETKVSSWLFAKDQERLKETFKVLVPKIDSYIKSQEYNSKEDNCQDALRVLVTLIDDIHQNPTKFSYEALLPLLKYYQVVLVENWNTYEKGSKPELKISLLTQSSCINDEGVVSLQFAVENGKNSSPISHVSLKLKECKEVESCLYKEDVYIEYLKGGDQPLIFHVDLNVKPEYYNEKAFSISAVCQYRNTNDESLAYEENMAVRLYSENEYEHINNPYNAGDAVANRDMFFGRDAFINNMADVMNSSPSKQLIIYGQKRSGKSSVLHWLKDRLISQGAFCVGFSLGLIQNNPSAEQFFYMILQSIEKGLYRWKGTKPSFTVPRIADFIAENPTNPVVTFSNYMFKFKEACKETEGWEERLIVVMIDEFTYLYTGIMNGKIDPSIMQQWKSVIQNPDSSFASVMVGQDVIPYFKNEPYARNAFQMIEDYRLTYLEEADARDLITKPIKTKTDIYASGAVDLILQYTACNPYYIQMLCSELISYMNGRKAIIATTSDVMAVANSIISKMTDRDFDNLLSPGDAINIDGVTGKNMMAVLYRIAKLTENTEYCTPSDIVNFYKEELIENEGEIVTKVLENLFEREVVDKKEGLCRIKVKLFKQWMLNQDPESASLKTPEK